MGKKEKISVMMRREKELLQGKVTGKYTLPIYSAVYNAKNPLFSVNCNPKVLFICIITRKQVSELLLFIS